MHVEAPAVRRCRAFAAAALALCVAPAHAAAPTQRDGEWTVTGVEEDDYFAPHNKDEHYTQGLRLSATSPDLDWSWPFDRLPWAFPDDAPAGSALTRRYNIAFGQNMYTPHDRSLVIPDPRDRPYAGWLYAGFGLMQDSGSEFDELALKLGVVGPAAMAREVQTDWHLNVIGTKPFLGWASQLRNEPALDLYYDRKWRLPQSEAAEGGGWGWDLLPQASARVGNVYDYLGGGGMLRFGRNLATDYGPPHIDLNTGSDYIDPERGDGGLGVYVFLGGEARLVARNIFLDGNSFQSSAHVSKYPAVADGQIGLAVTRGHLRLAYTLTYRTPEFVNQEGADHFGSLELSFHCWIGRCFD